MYNAFLELFEAKEREREVTKARERMYERVRKKERVSKNSKQEQRGNTRDQKITVVSKLDQLHAGI